MCVNLLGLLAIVGTLAALLNFFLFSEIEKSNIVYHCVNYKIIDFFQRIGESEENKGYNVISNACMLPKNGVMCKWAKSRSCSSPSKLAKFVDLPVLRRVHEKNLMKMEIYCYELAHCNLDSV